jgi:hypothetical protein
MIYLDPASIHNWLVREHGLVSNRLHVHGPSRTTSGAALYASYILEDLPDHTPVKLSEPMKFSYHGLSLQVSTFVREDESAPSKDAR